MSRLEEASKLSYVDWVAEQPNIDQVPEHEFSAEHIKQMEKLFDKMRGDKYHHFTRKTVRVMVVAAVLLALMLTAFVIPSSREFLIKSFDVFGVYEITEHNNNSVANKIEVGYIPEGYELKTVDEKDKAITYIFKSNDEQCFVISKNSSSIKVEYNTEDEHIDEYVVGNNIYTYYANKSGMNSFIWNENDYVYKVEGDFSKEELLKIAHTVK